jgi:signal transduction histidine kinase
VIASLEEIDRQRRRLLQHVVRAAEEERHRIANDIHDDPVQKMVAVKMRLELLRKMHPDLPEIEEAQSVMLSTIKSMRTMLFDLSPPTLEEEGLASALRYFLGNSNAPFAWSVDDDGLEAEPSTQTGLILYRIAQEAFANARKHAEAEQVRLTLAQRDGGVSMEIVDDGVGFQPQEAVVAAPGHLGLAAMRERAEMAGGWCSLWSLPGAGTTLEVWLPWEESSGVSTPSDGSDASIADVLRLPADRIVDAARAEDPRLARSDGLRP